MLTLLTATKKAKPPIDYGIKYLDGMVRAIKAKELALDDKTITKRIIFYTVKYLSIINIKGMSRESLEGILVFDQMLLNQICELTPAELLTIVNFHIISDWFNHNKTDRNVRKTVKIMAG